MATGVSARDINDTAWVRQAMFIPGRTRTTSKLENIAKSEQFSEQSLQFADTSLGGNKSINPKPQFTLNADPNVDSLLSKRSNFAKSDRNSSMGMGRYYGESIDRRQQRIFMQYGIPRHNSLSGFFGGYYNVDQGNLANTGRVKSLLSTIGKYVGYVILLPVLPFLAAGVLVYKGVVGGLLGMPLGKFYSMSPAMPLYWSSVTNIVNVLAVNLEVIAGVDSDQIKIGDAGPESPGMTAAQNKEMNRLLPDIMRNDGDGGGGINIKGVATRYQRLSNAHQRKFSEIYQAAGSDEEARAAIQKYLEADPSAFTVESEASMGESIKAYLDSENNQQTTLESNLLSAGGKDAKTKLKSISEQERAIKDFRAAQARGVNTIRNGSKLDTSWFGLNNFYDKLKDTMLAEARQGSDFISFAVNDTGTVSESFTNTSKASDVAESMNQTSSSARNKIFNMAGGNIGDGMAADALEFLGSGIKSLVENTADMVGLSGLAALGGKAFVDIPEFWESSSVTMPSESFTMELRTPYGNTMSILTNILVPLACILAGVAPRSTGKASYTGPFLCKLWSKGKSQVQLGIIDSLSITRGTGNVGFNVNGLATGIDVTFTVLNLSKMLHVPISAEVGVLDQFGFSQFDEDSNFTDYMAVLSSLGMIEQHSKFNNWRLKRARASANFDSWLSIDNFSQWALSGTTGSIIKAVASDPAIGN